MNKKLGISCMALGLLLLAAAASLLAHNRLEAARAAEAAGSILPKLIREIPEQKPPGESQRDPAEPEPAAEQPVPEMTIAEIDGYGYVGYLSVPALDLELPVMSEWDYTRLKTAPCLYYGSVYTDDMVIAGHNYSRHFGRLSDLDIGDSVRFTTMDGDIFDYTVGSIETLQPTAAEEMTDSGWDLTLFTCTQGGARRVTVRCGRAD